MIAKLSDLLIALLDAQVDFVLAGGLAAAAQGAPVTTFDVDIVHERSPANVDRLVSVLDRLHAVIREPARRHLPPNRESLLGRGHNLFVTDLGPLDCLGAIEGGLDFEQLVGQCAEITLRNRKLRVLPLPLLLTLKEQWSDEESKLRAALLRRTLKAQE